MGALVSLEQFYDAPLRCFTFLDFQLASTVEEFERIMGHNLKHHEMFISFGEKPTQEMIVFALYLPVKELASNLETIRELQGFLRKYLEAKALTLENQGNCKSFKDVLALLIYGIVMFPSEDDFMDLQAIHVFFTKNLVPTL